MYNRRLIIGLWRVKLHSSTVSVYWYYWLTYASCRSHPFTVQTSALQFVIENKHVETKSTDM